MIWKPAVTVAAVIERDGRFLLVEEETVAGRRYNQPAGHLDPGESLLEGVVRETLEETGYRFEPRALLGVYQYDHVAEGATYIRFAFTGEIGTGEPARELDAGIVRTVWLSREEARREAPRHRSPLVMRCIEDYLAGQRFPLAVLHRHVGPA
jgi:8-oxo-dGTP pyrophosphatase MutT (NUDIX family)